MKCPKCVAAGLRSCVQPSVFGAGCFSADGFYWDEDGKPHDHRYQVSSDHYSCSNGHEFEKNRRLKKWPCPTCKRSFVTCWDTAKEPAA